MVKKKRKSNVEAKPSFRKLHVPSLGLSMGLICAASAFLLGIMASMGKGEVLVNVLSEFYLGYSSTFVGSIIGGIWGFIDGLIFGSLLAYLYNIFLGK